MGTMLNRFHIFFVNLVHDDENDPQEALVEYLQGFSLERRVECLRYLMVEYDNGQLDILHKFRYENDTFMWPPGTPDELQDGLGTIDTTIEKVRAVLEKYVPEALVKAEMQLASIPASYSSPLQQAKDILNDLDSKVAAKSTPSAPTSEKEILRGPDAADFLQISLSKLYKIKGLAFKAEGSSGNYYHKGDLIAYLSKAHEKLKAGRAQQATAAAPLQPDAEPSQPVRHSRKRKG